MSYTVNLMDPPVYSPTMNKRSIITDPVILTCTNPITVCVTHCGIPSYFIMNPSLDFTTIQSIKEEKIKVGDKINVQVVKPIKFTSKL